MEGSLVMLERHLDVYIQRQHRSRQFMEYVIETYTQVNDERLVEVDWLPSMRLKKTAAWRVALKKFLMGKQARGGGGATAAALV